jgi:hypothetical protein
MLAQAQTPVQINSNNLTVQKKSLQLINKKTVFSLPPTVIKPLFTHEEQVQQSIDKLNARINKFNAKNTLSSKLSKEFRGVRNTLKFGSDRVNMFNDELTNTKAFKALDNIKPLQKRDFTAKNLFKYAMKSRLFYTLTNEFNQNILDKTGNCIFLLDADGNKIKRQIFSQDTLVSMARNILKERNNIK